MNILLGIISIIVSFSIILLMYKLFGKIGVFSWIAIATILANIQVIKNIEILSLTSTLGNVLYGSIFLATDILNEHYNEKIANKGVIIGFIASAALVLFGLITNAYIPASSDVSSEALKVVFSSTLRVVLGGFAAYLISQLLDVKLFQVIKKKTKGKHLWLRNNLATIVSQLIDTLIFVSIAFIGIYSKEVLIEIYLTTFIFKLIVSLFDTPFIYLSKKISPKE